MTVQVVNHELLSDNDCFGCGWENPQGLRIKISPDPEDPKKAELSNGGPKIISTIKTCKSFKSYQSGSIKHK